MIDAVLQHLDQQREPALARLKQLLAIPSVSTDPEYQPHVLRAADWVAQALREAGLEVSIEPTAGHPVVLAHSPGHQKSDGGADRQPHVVYYGHYDVQPPEPIDLWKSPPFEPVVRDGAVFARGASDDKGQIVCMIEALRAWHKTHGRFPLPVTVIIEGEEECGSAHLKPYLEKNRARLQKRVGPRGVVLISDSTMWNRDTPAVTYALRGLVYFDVQLHNSNRDLHSGMFGGVLANPATMLTRVLGQLFDDQHRVAIPGFYDDVVPLSDEERKRWATLGFDERRHCLDSIGVATPFGEAGFSTLERRWARPACDINGIYGGYGGAGAKTVIPSFAAAKVSFRIVANQCPQKIAAAFESWLQSHDVHGCRWQITQYGAADPVMVPVDSPYMAAATRALQRAAGKKPVLVRDGATIPVVGDFKKILGLDSLLIGFGLEGDCIHAPNERFALDRFELGCRTHAVLLEELAR